jgi:hypothetical protein
MNESQKLKEYLRINGKTKVNKSQTPNRITKTKPNGGSEMPQIAIDKRRRVKREMQTKETQRK